MIDTYLHGTSNHRAELPSLQVASRAALDNPHYITNLRRLLLVVRIELLPLVDDSFVNWMSYSTRHLNDNRLSHLGRNYFAHLLVFVRDLFSLLCWRNHRLTLVSFLTSFSFSQATLL